MEVSDHADDGIRYREVLVRVGGALARFATSCLVIAALAGCASQDLSALADSVNQRLNPDPEDRIVPYLRTPQGDPMTFRQMHAAKAAADEQKRQGALAVQRQAVEFAEQRRKAQEADRLAKENVQRQDIARGFLRVTLSEFELDRKRYQRGRKVAIAGWYQIEGEFETISDPLTAGTYRLPLLTEDAPRDVRMLLQRCRIIGRCPVVVLGHIAECRVSRQLLPGKDEVCVVVDDARWGG